MIKVCQCWDDGALNDLKVTALCRKYNAKATFNLNPGSHRSDARIVDSGHRLANGYYSGRLAWNEVVSVYEGFEVASHGMCHLQADWVDPQVFLSDAVSARKILEDKFQKPCRGFAWPCGRFTAETCDLLRNAGFAYGRTTKYTQAVLPCADFMQLASNCHFQDPEFWTKFEQARKSGVFYFWGHSYEMFDDPALLADYEAKLRRLNEDPEVEWINVVDLVDL